MTPLERAFCILGIWTAISFGICGVMIAYAHLVERVKHLPQRWQRERIAAPTRPPRSTRPPNG